MSAAAFCAAVAYSTGVFLGGALLVALALQRRWRASALALSGAMGGFGLVLLVQWRATGVPDVFLKASRQFHGLLPLQTLGQAITSWPSATVGHSGFFTGLQTVTIVIICIAATVGTLWKRPTGSAGISLTVALAYWLLPHLTGRADLSFYRSEALVMPVVLSLAFLPRAVLWTLAAEFAWISYRMARLFFTWYLV